MVVVDMGVLAMGYALTQTPAAAYLDGVAMMPTTVVPPLVLLCHTRPLLPRPQTTMVVPPLVSQHQPDAERHAILATRYQRFKALYLALEPHFPSA